VGGNNKKVPRLKMLVKQRNDAAAAISMNVVQQGRCNITWYS